MEINNIENISNEDWIKINKFTVEMLNFENDTKFRYACLKRLGDLIDFDVADFYIPASGKDKNKNRTLHDPVYISFIDGEKTKNFLHDYNSIYYCMDYLNWIYYAKESVVYREEDLISLSNREISPYYKDFLKPYGLTNVAGISINTDGICVGAITMYKDSKKEAFSDRDLSILKILEPHLSKVLYDMYKNKKYYENPQVILQIKYGLTVRECEITMLSLEGLDNKEIADKLKVSVNTIKKHMGNIFAKIEVTNRMQLIQKLLDEGLRQ